MGLKVGIVKIEEYNPKWSEMYNEEKQNLQNIFGDLALQIEHVGSTSIYGLPSKPIIDIMVVLNSFKDFEKVKKAFLCEPYSIKEDGRSDEILIRKGKEDNRTHFIHVTEKSLSRSCDMLLFRDYLRNHTDALEEYANLKKELAKKYADNREMYTKSKNAFITDIIIKAHSEIGQ